jgi:hypothetical protein
MKKYVILGDDPATVNYGRTLLTVQLTKDNTFRIVSLKSWMVANPIVPTDIKTNFRKVLTKYRRSVKALITEHGYPDIWIAERFMPRGGLVQLGEAITCMLAVTALQLKSTVCTVIPAVTWKSQIKRYYDLSEIYAEVKPCPPHLVDSTFIALYGLYSHLGVKPYSTLSDRNVGRIIAGLKEIGFRVDEEAKAAKKAKRISKPRIKTCIIKK